MRGLYFDIGATGAVVGMNNFQLFMSGANQVVDLVGHIGSVILIAVMLFKNKTHSKALLKTFLDLVQRKR